MSNGKSTKELIKDGNYQEAMEQAEAEARHLVEKKLERTKIREYFCQIKEIATELKAGKKTVDQAKVKLLKMKAKAAYDSKRQGVKGVDALKPLIDVFVERVKNLRSNPEEFKKEVLGFCDFFECLVGYHYFHSAKE
ncbi:MAG: type III-A CRISPR-associated protein Csm2 [candidate division WOR-3 bacterium]